jgi:hypothetical protein
MRLAAFTLAAGINSLRSFPVPQQFPRRDRILAVLLAAACLAFACTRRLYAWHLASMYMN